MANPVRPTPTNILANLDKFVKDELANGNIPKDAKYALVATLDNDGTRLLASVNIFRNDKVTTKAMAIWEHDWDGDDSVAAKIVFTGR